MSNKLRFYGGKKVTNTRTITNQIGPDVTGVATKRTSGKSGYFNTIYVNYGGSDTNDGFPWTAIRHVQNACNVTTRGLTFTAGTGVSGASVINITTNGIVPILANEIAGSAIYIPATGATYSCLSNTAELTGTGAFTITLTSPIGTAFTNQSVTVNAVASYVCIMDDGVYDEIVDAKKKIITCSMNKHPTIKYPASNPEAYAADPGYVTAYNYYGNSESSLRGIGGTFFTGLIQDYQIIDGVHWIASTNGLWYSYIGYTGWYLVPGTAGQNWNDLVFNGGQLYARFAHATPANNTVSTVTTTGVATVLTQGAGQTFKQLRGNADVLVLLTEGAFPLSNYVWKNSAGVWTTTAADPLYQTGGWSKCLRTPFVYEGYYCFLYLCGGGYPSIDGFMIKKDTAPVTDRSFGVSNTSCSSMETDSGYFDEENQIFYFTKPGTGAGLARMVIGDITYATATNTFYMKLQNTGLGNVTKITDIDGKHYLHYYAAMYTSTDFTTRTAVANVSNGAGASYDQTPMAIYDSDIGRVITCNRFEAARGLAMYIWKQFCVYNFNQLSGITVDGNYQAKSGAFVSYSNGEHEVMWYSLVKNCLVAGILDGGVIDQRSKILNTEVYGCGVGIKVPDFVVTLMRLYRCFIHDNQYGVTCIGYSFMYGPEMYNSVITNNTVKGVWYERLGPLQNDPYAGLIKWCICYGNGIDLVMKNRLTPSVLNGVINSVVGTYDVDPVVIFSNFSQVNPLLLTNGDYKDTYGGYAYDSIAYTVGAGMFTYTRSRSTTYTKDHHLTYLPVEEAINWKVSNFSSTENAYGEYSESFDGMSRTFNLTWNKDSMSTPTEYFKIIDLWKDEDGVFMFGASDGTNWVDQQNQTPEIHEADDSTEFLTTTNHPTVGLNQYAGWYAEVLDDDSGNWIYIRILSHNAGDGTVPIRYQLDRASYPGYFFILSGPMKIVNIPVKIDKSAGFNSSMYGYVNTPLTGYSLSLREVRYV